MLQQEGIVVNGEVSHGTVPSGAVVIATHLSPPLMDILRLMNKPSDNVIAELIFKTIGAEVKGEPGTWQKGRQVIGEFLGEMGAGFRIVDGSGLSRYNLVTAELLVNLLVFVYNDFELMPDYVASLPIAGVDGTLKNRMKGNARRESSTRENGHLKRRFCARRLYRHCRW